jgi:hypothetical protein
MSLDKCDVTGSTDRVQYLPSYMQTDKVKKVCFNVALKMEKERLNGGEKASEEVVEKKPVRKPVKTKKKAK